MKLPEDKRHLFKRPVGKLFRNSKDAFDYLGSIDYEKIITVGDVVSSDFLRNDFEPDMVVVDYSTKRSPADKKDIEIIKNYSVPEINVKNPAGHITEDLWEIIETVETPVKIIVDGEEDMATLPVTLTAPNGSVVVYGQPDEGLVIIEVSDEKKEEFENFLDVFEK